MKNKTDKIFYEIGKHELADLEEYANDTQDRLDFLENQLDIIYVKMLEKTLDFEDCKIMKGLVQTVKMMGQLNDLMFDLRGKSMSGMLIPIEQIHFDERERAGKTVIEAL